MRLIRLVRMVREGDALCGQHLPIGFKGVIEIALVEYDQRVD